MKASKERVNKLNLYEWLFIAACFVFYFLWSIPKPLGYGPDEAMRYAIPKFIFENATLPDGYDVSLRTVWGFSYAFYPNFLGPIASSLLMKLVSVVSAGEHILLIAARFVSVVSGTITVLFSMKISKQLFEEASHWFLPVLIATIPQFVFLSSYVNNDSICICGSSIIIYAWVCGLKDKWSLKNAVILSVGIVIVALSYYNAYGWILGSILLFFFSYIFKIGKNSGYKDMLKMGCIIATIVLVCISYFFIRNAVLYNGDFLGLTALEESSEKYAVDGVKPSQRVIPYNTGQSLFDMLFKVDPRIGRSWIVSSYRSFIGVLCAMSVPMTGFIYHMYDVIFLLSILGLIFLWIKNRFVLHIKFTPKGILFESCMLLCIIIPFLLSVYYSYKVDFQAQGRYCYPMVIGLMYFISKGLSCWIESIPQKLVRKYSVAGVCTLLCICSIYVYYAIYLPSSM